MLHRIIFTIILFFSIINLQAQERVITAGIQFKPMLPPGFFNAESAEEIADGINFKTDQKFGYAAGMVIRWGLTRTISLETGINYVRRNFNITIDSLNSAYEQEIDYGIIGYEIPITGLIYVQLSDEWFMNAAFGASLDLFPRDFYADASGDQRWIHETVRESWIQVAGLANLGFEYRTEESGYFYIGSSYHQPFTDMYQSKIGRDDARNATVILPVNGSYLTLDFRYFFHEDPQKKKRKKKKNKK